MKLYLVQHGNSLSKEEDPDRHLSKQGINDIENLSIFLKNKKIKVKNIFHSKKERAIQTAQLLYDALKSENEKVNILAIDNLNPNDQIEPLITKIKTWNEDNLIVGHLPYLSKLIGSLVTKDENKIITNYCQGTISCLELGESNNWEISWMLKPFLL